MVLTTKTTISFRGVGSADWLKKGCTVLLLTLEWHFSCISGAHTVT